MSSAPTDCRVPDPTDATADGQFQQVNRRAGYGDDRLDRIIATARKGWTLAAGEGLVLVQEIDRLRVRCRQIDDEAYDYAEQIEPLRAVRARRNVLVEVSPELLSLDAFTEDPLYVMLTDNGDGTHMLTFRRHNDRAERILAKLREPSEAVIRAAQQKWDGDYCHMDDAICAAVAAAEQEVNDDPR